MTQSRWSLENELYELKIDDISYLYVPHFILYTCLTKPHAQEFGIDIMGEAKKKASLSAPRVICIFMMPMSATRMQQLPIPTPATTPHMMSHNSSSYVPRPLILPLASAAERHRRMVVSAFSFTDRCQETAYAATELGRDGRYRQCGEQRPFGKRGLW